MKSKPKSVALRGSHEERLLAEATPRRRRSRRSHGQMPDAIKRWVETRLRQARRRATIAAGSGDKIRLLHNTSKMAVLIDLQNAFPSQPRQASARANGLMSGGANEK